MSVRAPYRPALKHSRFYYWFVVLAGVAGGYCACDDVQRRARQ